MPGQADMRLFSPPGGSFRGTEAESKARWRSAVFRRIWRALFSGRLGQTWGVQKAWVYPTSTRAKAQEMESSREVQPSSMPGRRWVWTSTRPTRVGSVFANNSYCSVWGGVIFFEGFLPSLGGGGLRNDPGGPRRPPAGTVPQPPPA